MRVLGCVAWCWWFCVKRGLRINRIAFHLLSDCKPDFVLSTSFVVMDINETLMFWRYRHALMAERVIGRGIRYRRLGGA